MLRDTNHQDTTTELFGHKISAPIVFAPIGVNKIDHADGELAPAKVAGELGLPYCLRYLHPRFKTPLQNSSCRTGEMMVVRREVNQLKMLVKQTTRDPDFTNYISPTTTN